MIEVFFFVLLQEGESHRAEEEDGVQEKGKTDDLKPGGENNEACLSDPKREDGEEEEGEGGGEAEEEDEEDLQNGETDRKAASSANDGLPRGLVTWREAVRGAQNAAQLAMAFYVLETSVAWDKSIMKASCQVWSL